MLNLRRNQNISVGKRGEDEAVRFFKKQGFKILERNYVAEGHEIDVIAKDKKFLNKCLCPYCSSCCKG